jgi:hypothetical protein
MLSRLALERNLWDRSAAVPTERELASNLAETASGVSGAFSRIFAGNAPTLPISLVP